MLINISPSQINNFARYMDSDLEYETLERLLDKITGEFVMTEKMYFGEAYHTLIENGGSKLSDNSAFYVNVLRPGEPVNQIRIPRTMAMHGIEWHDRNPGVHEVRTQKIYEIKERGFTVQMNGRIDFSDFMKIVDFKVPERPPKYDDFNNDYQWRCYLDMMGLDWFQYEFFIVNHKRITVVRDTYQFFSYQGMSEDIRQMISRYLEFIEIHNLWEYYRISKLKMTN